MQCWACSGDPETVALVIRGLERGPADALATLVREHGPRLLVHGRRNLVAVQEGCDGTAVRALVFLPPDRVSALRRLGVRSLEAFLSERATGVPVRA